MKLKELYKKAVVYPGVLLILLTFLYSTVAYWNYQEENYAKWEVIGMTIVLALAYWLFICLLSRTMFLNNLEKVRSNALLSAVSWFLLPFGFMLAVIGKAVNEVVTVGSTWELLYAFVANVPFMSGLVWSFNRFKKNRPPLTDRL